MRFFLLVHLDFSTRDAAVQQPDDDDNEKGSHLQFRSGPRTLIAKTIGGRCPSYRNVIPGYPPALSQTSGSSGIKNNGDHFSGLTDSLSCTS